MANSIRRNRQINIRFTVLGNELSRALIWVLRPLKREISLSGLKILRSLVTLKALIDVGSTNEIRIAKTILKSSTFHSERR